MRIIFAFLLPLAGLLAEASSLQPHFSETQFSPAFGLMLTDFSLGSSGASYNSSPEVGYMLGLSAYIPSDSPYIDYISGIYYWNSRTRFESNFQEGSVNVYQDSLVEVSRLSLPLVAKIFPFEKPHWFYAKAGLINHFLLSVSESTTLTTSTGASATQQSFFTDQDNYEPWFLDGSLGIGIEPRLSSHFGFFVELNYLYGLTPVIKGDSGIRSSTFFTSFGIGF